MKYNYIWLADYSDRTHPGGAQLTNRKIIDRGREMGFEINEVYLADIKEGFDFALKNSTDPLNPGKSEWEDIFIINNYVKLYSLNPKLIEYILKRFRFVRFVHDYDFAYRGMIPDRLIKKVFEKAEISFFLSPTHLNQTKLAGIDIKKEYIIPSAIDIDEYSRAGYYANKNNTRVKNTIIYIGEVASHKGINNIINYALLNPHMRLDICGWVAEPHLLNSLPKNVRVLAKIDHDKMPEFLTKYEYSIHMPIWFEPFGRSVAEAFFAGCKLITNDRIGFLDYIKKVEDIPILVKIIKESPTVFWLKVDQSVKTMDDASKQK